MPDERLSERAAERCLLEPGGLSPASLEHALAGAWSRACSYADVYLQRVERESLSIEDGVVKDASYDLEQGLGVRATAAEKTGFAYSEELGPKQLQAAARAARAVADGSRRLKKSSFLQIRQNLGSPVSHKLKNLLYNFVNT